MAAFDYGNYTQSSSNIWGKAWQQEIKKEEKVKNVPVKQQQAPSETAGLDTFNRTGEVAQANYAMGGMNVKRGISTSPTAVTDRAEEMYTAQAERQGYLAEELGIPVAATVNGVEPEFLNEMNVSPLLAMHLNMEAGAGTATRLEQGMPMLS